MPELRLVKGGIDTHLTQCVLLDQEGVVDASVWYSGGDLHAHVTVDDESGLSRLDLQGLCMERLGLHQTPKSITLVQARRRAA